MKRWKGTGTQGERNGREKGVKQDLTSVQTATKIDRSSPRKMG